MQTLGLHFSNNGWEIPGATREHMQPLGDLYFQSTPDDQLACLEMQAFVPARARRTSFWRAYSTNVDSSSYTATNSLHYFEWQIARLDSWQAPEMDGYFKHVRQTCREHGERQWSKMIDRSCAHCGLADVQLSKCQACRLVYYCSTVCQRSDPGTRSFVVWVVAHAIQTHGRCRFWL